ncbi:hypothetical protein ABGA94_16900, partial [Stenotrophomonas sp. 3diitr2024]
RVRVAGDAELARRLQQLAKGFDPDWQQPFVSVFGEVLGVQVANTLRRLLDDPRCSAVVAPTRRPLALTHGKLENPVLAFDALPTSPEWAR